jgi:hypothetical protein
MRTRTAMLLAMLLTLAAARSVRAAETASSPTETENKQLRNEVRTLRTQLDMVMKRLDAIEKRVESAPPSSKQSSGAVATTAAPPAPAQSQAATGAPPPGVTPAGVPLAENPPPGVSVGSAVKSLLPGPVTHPTSMGPGYAGAYGAEPQQGVIVPGIQGVPKVFIPDIGAVGDFTLRQSDLRKGDPRYNPADDKFQPRDTQLIFFSPIDPYTNAQISIDKPFDGPMDIEEAFLVFNKLPYDLTVRAGQYRTHFGLINEVDTFQLPMVNRPDALARYIGQDGFVEPGVEVNGYVPNPWDADLKADFNMVSGVNTVSFDHRGGQNFDFAYIGTLSYARELFTTGAMTSGVSFAGGPGPGGQAYLVDPYLQFQYAPDQRHIWTWDIESLLASREGVGDHGLKRGLYSLLDYNFALRYHAGFLVDMADVPNVPSGTEVGVSPILTWFISDNTRLRAQYTHTTGSGAERAVDALYLQATFSLGNLKPLD